MYGLDLFALELHKVIPNLADVGKFIKRWNLLEDTIRQRDAGSTQILVPSRVKLGTWNPRSDIASRFSICKSSIGRRTPDVLWLWNIGKNTFDPMNDARRRPSLFSNPLEFCRPKEFHQKTASHRSKSVDASFLSEDISNYTS